MYQLDKNKIIVPRAELDLKTTLECGQTFRFTASKGKYTVISANHVALCYEEGENSIIQTDSIDYFVTFFDLDVCYDEIVEKYVAVHDAFICEAAKYGSGIKILRQDSAEMIFQFIISANNNIPRIKKIIEKISLTLGSPLGVSLHSQNVNSIVLSNYDSTEQIYQKVESILEQKTMQDRLDAMAIMNEQPLNRRSAIAENTENTIDTLKKTTSAELPELYMFPSVEVLAAASIETLRECGAGYRAPYLIETAVFLRDNPSFIEEISALPTEAALKMLLSLKGVGPKVADCILLFGFHRTDTYPVDTWIEKHYRKYSGDLVSTPKEIRKIMLTRFGIDSGIVQQYIFNFIRNVSSD